MATINTRVVLRNDTKAAWEAIKDNRDLALLEGEMGIETDTGLFKIGKKIEVNGEMVLATWAELEYANEIPEVDLSTVTNHVKVVDGTVDDLGVGTVVGDMGIVRAVINGDVKSHTAYVWNGTAWEAMDGNYSAANVFLPSDIVLAGDYGTDSRGDRITSLGNYRMGNTIAAGSSIESVFNGLFTKEISENLANASPTTTINATKDTYLLVGADSTAQTVTLSLNKGSYDNGYGYVVSKNETGIADGTKAVTVVTNDGTGVEANQYYFNGTAQNVNSYSVASTKKTTAPAAETIKAKISYKNAGHPVSNLKNIYPTQTLADGTTSEVSATLNKWYYPIYQGFTYADTAIEDHANITADQLKALGAPTASLVVGSTTHTSTNSKAVITGAAAYDKTKMKKAIAAKAWRQYYVAYPASYNYSMSGAKDTNNLDLTIRDAGNVTFNFNGIDVEYKVQYIHNGSDYGTRVIYWNM
jgi:hypothetical protein